MKKHNENYQVQKRLLKDRSYSSAKMDPLLEMLKKSDTNKKYKSKLDISDPYGEIKNRKLSAAVSETEMNEIPPTSKLIPLPKRTREKFVQHRRHSNHPSKARWHTAARTYWGNRSHQKLHVAWQRGLEATRIPPFAAFVILNAVEVVEPARRDPRSPRLPRDTRRGHADNIIEIFLQVFQQNGVHFLGHGIM